ncbi:MAG: GNAT family N-acetyltransferase [Burkholderiales bacterium]|nr:MAG: GNAT family N-acetyltransferase [Burkholderiales bacterium]
MSFEISLYDPAQSYVGQKQFDCGNASINSFVHGSLKPQVKKSLSVAYVLTDSAQEHCFAGFYTLAQHMIDVSALSALELGSLPRKIPCSRLIMLGIDKRYQGQQLGSRIMKHALLLTQTIAKQIGGYGLYLDADAKAVAFYQKLGFVLLEGDLSPEPSPMFLPISAIKTLR